MNTMDIEKAMGIIASDNVVDTISIGYVIDALLLEVLYQPPVVIEWRKSFYDFAKIIRKDTQALSFGYILNDISEWNRQLYPLVEVLHNNEVLLGLLSQFGLGIDMLKRKL